MEEDEKQLSPPVWAVNYPDIGTLYRGEEGLGAALTDQAPAAETRSRALTPEELTALFREDLLRELGWDCGQLGGESGRRRRPLSPSPWLRETCPPQGRPSPAGQ